QVKWLTQMQIRPKDGRPLTAGNEYQIDTDLAEITEEIVPIVFKPRIATEEQRAALFDIASKIPLTHDELQKLFRACLPSEIVVRSEAQTLWSSPGFADQNQRLWHILDFMWNIPLQPNKRLPVLEFVERLARHSRNQLILHRTLLQVIWPR